MQMSREIRVEALRLAKILAKDLIRANGLRVCGYTPKEIEACAEVIIEHRPERIIPRAWDNCKMRWEAAREAEGRAMTERYVLALAEHITRYALKTRIREAGQRISNYSPKEIAQRVRRMLRNDPWFGEQAERILAEAKERNKVRL